MGLNLVEHLCPGLRRIGVVGYGNDPLGKKGRIVHKLRKNRTTELNNLSFDYVSSLIVALQFMLLWFFLHSVS